MIVKHARKYDAANCVAQLKHTKETTMEEREEKKEMTLKDRINRYLDLLDETNKIEKEKLQLILDLTDRIFIGLPIW